MNGKQDKTNRLMAAAACCAVFCVYVIIQGALHFGNVSDGHDLTCYLGPFAATVFLSACVGYLTFQLFRRKK